MQHLRLPTLLLLSFLSPALAQPDTPAPPAAKDPRPKIVDVSDQLETIRAQHDVPGMAVVVTRGRDIIAQGASGVRKHGDLSPVTINDKFHLGSCTKSMTGTLIGLLVEEGKLSWTSTIGEVFPDLKDKMDAQWADVTVVQLLSHRAGVPSDLSKDGLWGNLWKHKGTPTDQRMELLEGVTKYPPLHKPGTKYLYSNAGVAIAGAMAEKVTGKAWEDLMQERIFRPLGITSAGFGAPGTKGRTDQPCGHGADNTPVEPGPKSDNPPAIAPAGTAHMSVPDWARYISIHTGGERADRAPGEWILKPETFKKLHTPYDAPGAEYACGWIVTTRPWAKAERGTGRVLYHNGSNTMWYCVAWLAPEKDCAVIVACNKADTASQKACDEAATRMIVLYINSVK